VPTANWKRTGESLVRRRIELDPRYANRRLFAAERGLNYRIITDLEHGRRGNYEPSTLTAAEVAYGLAAGSIARSAAGGELEPLPVTAPPEPPASRYPPAPAAWDAGDPRDDVAARLFDGDTLHDRMIRNIWRLGEAYDTPPKKRIGMIRVVDPELADALDNVAGQSEAGLSRALQSHVRLHLHGNNSVT
jgi:hypothetical protein